MLINRFMSVAEFQKYLGIGRNKAYDLCRYENVPVIKVGTKILVDKEELDNTWIPNHLNTTLKGAKK